MTKRTYFALRGTQKDILRQLAELGSENDSGHARSELHDSNASVQAKNMLNARLRSIGSLDEKEIDFISRPEDVSRVVLGTKVALEYEADGQKDTQTVAVLGRDDAVVSLDWGNGVVAISPDSDIAKAIIGETTQFSFMLRRSGPKVTITGIEPLENLD